RHTLQRVSAGFSSKDEEFITSTNIDFHPTSLLEDADGSLLIIDTGGWFRIGCPTSQVARPEIKGGIYRVRRKDAPKIEDPWGLKINYRTASLDDLVRLLDDPRWAVRDRAVEEFLQRESEAYGPLGEVLSHGSPRARIAAVWILSRLGTKRAQALVR